MRSTHVLLYALFFCGAAAAPPAERHAAESVDAHAQPSYYSTQMLSLGFPEFVNQELGSKRLGISARYSYPQRHRLIETNSSLGNTSERISGNSTQSSSGGASAEAGAGNSTSSNSTQATACVPQSVPSADRCRYVRATEACTADDGLIHYRVLHYCTLQGHPAVSVVLQLGWLLLLFYILIATADEFFCPALEHLSKVLRLSDDVAGATLLSFGNGATDVFTQVAALASSSALAGPELQARIELALGAVLGAGIFICTVVMPAVVLSSPEGAVTVQRGPFLRDTVWYLAVVLALFACVLDGEIRTWEVASMSATYILYIVVVVAGSRGGGGGGGEDAHRMLDEMAGANELSTMALGGDAYTALLGGPQEAARPRGASDLALHGGEELALEAPASARARALAALHSVKAVAVVGLRPLGLALQTTMPVIEEDWGIAGAPLMVAAPVLCAPLFFVTSEGFVPALLPAPALIYGAVCSVVGVVAIYKLAVRARRGEGWSHIVVTIMACLTFAVAMVWMDVAAGELVAVFQALGEILRVSSAVLGATVLSWGISVGDLVADIAIARNGQPTAAIAACYAGPLFNLLCGTCVTFLFLCVSQHGAIRVQMAATVWVLFFFLLLALAHATLAVPLLHRWQLTRATAWALLGYYAAFTLVYILIDQARQR